MKRYEIMLNGSISQRPASTLNVEFSEHVRKNHSGARELCLRVVWPDNKQIDLPDAIDTSGGPMENRIWILVSRDEARFVTLGGRVAYWLTHGGDLESRVSLHRESIDEEFWDIRFLDNGEDQVVVYEGGVLLVDARMNVRWHVRKRYNDYFDGLDVGLLRFVCEGESWGLMMDSGVIVR